VSGLRDDDDVDDERNFMEESLELHNNVAEMVGTLFKMHGADYFPVYMEKWHEIIHNASQSYCLKEDRQFSYYVISDVIEYGLGSIHHNNNQTENFAALYFGLVMDLLIAVCATPHSAHSEVSGDDVLLKRTCCYAIGIAAELHPIEFEPFVQAALQALWVCVNAGDTEGPGSRGATTDNAISAVGLILESAESLSNASASSKSFNYVWGEWLSYQPLKDDIDEGGKVIAQLVRLVNRKHSSLVGQRDRLIMTLSIFLMVIDSEEYIPGGRSSPLSGQCKECVGGLLSLAAGFSIKSNFRSQDSSVESSSFSQWLAPFLCDKLRLIVAELGDSQLQQHPFYHQQFAASQGGCFDGSPLATAPIFDVIMRKV